MDVITYMQKIEAYVCRHFDDWDLDDPIEAGYHADYEELAGAKDEDIRHFEDHFQIALPSDIKALYRYKNGSGFFCVLPVSIGEREMPFSLMSLQEVEHIKEYFQNRDALLTDFPDFFSNADIEAMHDDRLRPYLFHRKWIPFAQYCDSCYLMLDFAPGEEGVDGQIICYIHDPDEVVYVASNLSNLIADIQEKILSEANE